jgi:hypothetical protein
MLMRVVVTVTTARTLAIRMSSVRIILREHQSVTVLRLLRHRHQLRLCPKKKPKKMLALTHMACNETE